MDLKLDKHQIEIIRNDGTMIYMAFAESPFVSSKGVPCTAR